ncbi:MAG: transposase family protein [Chloroflexi bacterium]|nr:transposase family protein [Chloroflexota bacterium]
MRIDERRKVLRRIQPRYGRASRKARSRMLDELQAITGLHRKSLIRLLRGDLRRKPRTRQRGPTDGPKVREAIRLWAQALDYPCAERLQPVRVPTAQHLARHGHLDLDAEAEAALARVSGCTVRRIVGPVRRQPDRLARPPALLGGGRRCTKRFPPTDRVPADVAEPGPLEVDTVHHAGPSTQGLYVVTRVWTDVATGWVASQAMLGTRGQAARHAFAALKARLPFPIRRIHTDNGPEFLNALLLAWAQQHAIPLERGRPYHKNDQRFVEENNGSHVRAYIGHGRPDTVAHVQALNRLYRRLDFYHNVFRSRPRNGSVTFSFGGARIDSAYPLSPTGPPGHKPSHKHRHTPPPHLSFVLASSRHFNASLI